MHAPPRTSRLPYRLLLTPDNDTSPRRERAPKTVLAVRRARGPTRREGPVLGRQDDEVAGRILGFSVGRRVGRDGAEASLQRFVRRGGAVVRAQVIPEEQRISVVRRSSDTDVDVRRPIAGTFVEEPLLPVGGIRAPAGWDVV